MYAGEDDYSNVLLMAYIDYMDCTVCYPRNHLLSPIPLFTRTIELSM